MPRNPTTGVFTRVSNSFSNPVQGTVIDPSDANDLFDDYDTGLSPPPAGLGPVSTAYLTPRQRRVTAAGAVTVSATTDDAVYVIKTIEAATDVNFPSVAARIAAGSGPIFICNEQSNPALYPLQPVPDGTDTIQRSVTPLPIDTNLGVWFWPDDSVTPNNWEIR